MDKPLSFTIRSMTANDLTAVEAIQAEAYAGYFLESAEIIAQRFYASQATAWVAEYDGQVCAYLVAYWSSVGKVNPLDAAFVTADTIDCLYLHDLALFKWAQGRGMAKQMIDTATAFAMRHTAQAIALLSVQNSKKFWQGFGFAEFKDLEIKQRENLVTYLDNDTDVAFYMVKKI